MLQSGQERGTGYIWVLNCKVLCTAFKYIGVRHVVHWLCRIHLWLCSQRRMNRHCFCKLVLFEHAPSTEDCFHVWTWQDGSSAMETEGHDKVRFVVICNALVDCAIYLWFFLGFSCYDFCKAKTSLGPVFQEHLDKDWHSVQCCYRLLLLNCFHALTWQDGSGAMETKRHEKAWVFGNLCIDLWIVPSICEIVKYHPARLFFMH